MCVLLACWWSPDAGSHRLCGGLVGGWSACSSQCGEGSTERSRQVLTPPRNGGTPCPDLKQRRGCLGHALQCSSAKEVAKILPDSFKRNFKDPWRRPHMLMKEEKPRGCCGWQGGHKHVSERSVPSSRGRALSPSLGWNSMASSTGKWVGEAHSRTG
ncbi:hypothetical protein ACEWY4_012336 [Coilia grayii]|uniref:Spondin-like TSP1 domain-containing protein n=1 Tax=Coilia grayii TaxID=363190 RepID=A0ABD1K0T1_9TELE